jgi:hypothetical protein
MKVMVSRGDLPFVVCCEPQGGDGRGILHIPKVLSLWRCRVQSVSQKSVHICDCLRLSGGFYQVPIPAYSNVKLTAKHAIFVNTYDSKSPGDIFTNTHFTAVLVQIHMQ